MMVPITINLAVEDSLSEVVLREIVKESHRQYAIGRCYCKGGYGYLKRTLPGFNNAAKGIPFLVLADLEAECPPVQIKEWLPVPFHHNLLFRIAVREVESWLLADRQGFASFLGIKQSLIPTRVDQIDDPKRCLINLTRKSRKREIREAIVPLQNTTAKVGPDYNGQLSHFVSTLWDIREAAKNSESLSRSVKAITLFQPNQ